MYTYNKKNLTFSLVLLSMLLFSGCGTNDNNTKSENNIRTETPKKLSTQVDPNKINQVEKLEKTSQIELELFREITRLLDGDSFIKQDKDYQTPSNLIEVKITNNIINLYFDELSIAKDFVMENFTDPLYTTAYFIAEKNKIDNPKVKIYFDGKSLSDIMDERDKEIEANFPQLKAQRKLLLKSSSKKVIINSGHGWTRNSNGWGWQRPVMSGGYVEDINNAEVGMILASKLKSSGIIYESVRELNKNAGNGVSGQAKWKENARQYMIAHKLPKSIWQSKNDGYWNNDIRSRPYFANYKKGGVLISIHSNAAVKSARGTKIYVSSKNNGYNQESIKLAKILKRHLLGKIHSKYDAKWSVSDPIAKNHGENRLATMPSVIIELGFHTNAQDRAALTNNIFRNAAMEGVTDAIKEYLNIGNTLPAIHGEFDGAGSLVSPTEDNWGCNKDEAVMHPHQGTGSTVVFQWAYDANTCTQLELFSSIPTKVAIKSKAWNSVKSDQAFTVTLSKSHPITLKSTGAKWSTFAVTSMGTIGQKTTITARCKGPSRPIYNGDKVNIPKDLVSIRYPYYWTGTGSIISYANNISGYGKIQDIATSSSQVNSVTSFQWATHSCKRLRLTNDGTNSYTPATILMKGWSDPTFHTKCNNQLPCTLQVNSDNYYVIQVASTKGAISSGKINADCI